MYVVIRYMSNHTYWKMRNFVFIMAGLDRIFHKITSEGNLHKDECHFCRTYTCIFKKVPSDKYKTRILYPK